VCFVTPLIVLMQWLANIHSLVIHQHDDLESFMAKRQPASSLGTLSVQDLRHELSRRERGAESLLRRRARLAAKLRALDDQLAEFGLSANTGSNGKRPKNQGTLVDALLTVFKGSTLSIAEAEAAVRKAGYRSNAKNFRTIVSIALSTSGKFKRVQRGIYVMK
jgi:hypothetical protein